MISDKASSVYIEGSLHRTYAMGLRAIEPTPNNLHLHLGIVSKNLNYPSVTHQLLLILQVSKMYPRHSHPTSIPESFEYFGYYSFNIIRNNY